MTRPLLGWLVLASVQATSSGCQSACFNVNQPECVDRFTGLRLVTHRFGDGLGTRDAVDDATVALRGDADLGTGWAVDTIDDSIVLGFPDASAVGVIATLRRVGDCPSTSTRLLGYVPDDSLARQPRLQLRVSGCADSDVEEQVLFTGPSDFGARVVPWPNPDGSWDLWVSGPSEGSARGALWRFTDAGTRAPSERGNDDAQLLEGQIPGEALGEILEVCGDLTGDGLPELAVGVPGFSGSTGFDASKLAGAVLLLSPSDLPSQGELTWSNARSVLWGAGLDRAGAAIACTDDIDGDGLVDLVIGSPLADGAAGTDSGQVQVVRGGDLPASAPLAEVAWLTWEGAQAGERLGTAVATADLDGDGLVELIAGAPGAETGGVGAGAIRVLAGTDRAGPGALFTGRPSAAVGDIDAVSRLGGTVVVGDLDNDGLPELIGGAWRSDRDAASLHAGEVVIWPGVLAAQSEGATHDSAVIIAGEGPHQEVGRRLRLLDVDGDGTRDLVTGARRRAQ